MALKSPLIVVGLVIFMGFWTNTEVYAQSGCDYIVGAGETFTDIGLTGSPNPKDVLDQTGINWAGKIICIRNNREYPSIKIEKSGSTTQRLVIKSHPQNSGKPVIRDTSPFPARDKQSSGKDGMKVDADNLIIDGFEVTRASKAGIALNQRKNVDFINLEVHDTFVEGINITESENVLVDRADVYRNELVGTVTDCLEQLPPDCTISEVVKATDSTNVTIQNTRIRQDMSPGRGGVLTAGRKSVNVKFLNNEIYQNTGNQMHIGNFEDIYFENNLIVGTTGDTGIGLFRLGERYPKDKFGYEFKGDNFVFKNNLLVSLSKGIAFNDCQGVEVPRPSPQKGYTYVWGEDEVCPFNNVTVENNTVVGIGAQDSGNNEDEEFALKFSAMRGYPAENIVVKNNIFHAVDDNRNDGPDLVNQLGSRVNFSNNIWSDNSQLSGTDIQIRNLTGVFPANPNLSQTFDGRVDPERYRVAAAFAGKGADVSKVGIGRGGDGPYPSPSLHPSPTPPASWDLNNDSKVNAYDFVTLVKGIGSIYTLSQVKPFLVDFLSD